MTVADRSMVITAGANGIGRAIARMAMAAGAGLSVIDREDDTLEEMRAGFEGEGGGIRTFAADCTDRNAVEETFRGIGQVDILVNGVGASAREGASEFWCSDVDVWRSVIDVSLVSAMLCARQVVPAMRERGFGRIVDISSDAALRPTPQLAEYAAAKAGVLGFTRALAVELDRLRSP